MLLVNVPATKFMSSFSTPYLVFMSGIKAGRITIWLSPGYRDASIENRYKRQETTVRAFRIKKGIYEIWILVLIATRMEAAVIRD